MTPPRMSLFDWIDRIGRPVFIRIMLPCAIVWFTWEVCVRWLHLLDRAIETGTPPPDITAGLTPIAVTVAPMLIPVVIDQWTRHLQRAREIDRGSAPPPFGRASAPPDDVSGPRPAENRQ